MSALCAVQTTARTPHLADLDSLDTADSFTSGNGFLDRPVPSYRTASAGGSTTMSNYPLIAVIGVTGAGKSTLINTASGRDDLAVSTGIESSDVWVGTQDVGPSYVYVNNKWVQLIDTPGWDDTNRSDTEILKLIGQWLGKSFGAKQLLHGVILLQPINVTRVYGTGKQRNRLFEEICGISAFSNIVIATTMSRSMEHWGAMIQGGATVVKHDNTQQSALAMINVLLSKQAKPLLLQHELALNDNHLANTSVGRQLTENMTAMNVNDQRRILELEAELRRSARDKAAMREEIRELGAKLYKRQRDVVEFHYYRPSETGRKTTSDNGHMPVLHAAPLCTGLLGSCGWGGTYLNLPLLQDYFL
ncbi:hypothetical protein CC86DRAFT_417293 [Ophiobolus disseminans]|uniref:G domain-containing protein n=1 Tax=Ophiobolus disseminans TaxID=1469910 RepID=A0A6A7A0G3_9PLEO|nr:hypothetical protein CC86DRAFT_417293 [Ophiobolus disseminans]